MAEDPRLLLHFKTLAKFKLKLADGTVNPNKHFVVIKDEKLIWIRGTYYTDNSKLENIDDIYNDWELSLTASEVIITLKGKLWNNITRLWDNISKVLSINLATQTISGLMSPSDKTKLDRINGTNYNISNPSTDSSSRTVKITGINPNDGTQISNEITIPAATLTEAGLESSSDKLIIDNVKLIHQISHVKDDNAFTSTATNVSLNFTCRNVTDPTTVATSDHSVGIGAASSTKAGVMTAQDKVELDRINTTNYDLNTVSDATSLSLNSTSLNINNNQTVNKVISIPLADATHTGVITAADKIYLDSLPTILANNKAESDNYTVNNIKISSNPIITGANANVTGYTKPSTTGAIVTSDTINSAIGKLETKTDNHITNTSNPHNVTKTQVGLGNCNNTSDADKPVSTALATAIADAKKAGTDAQTTIDNHKADKDKKHIPTGGHERQILTWLSDGTAKWEDLSNIFTDLEELLAYGVEYDEGVGDPHLTRIGSASLHKTLPIQSQLRGCIAQRDKVIYWLDGTDWRFRKDATTIAVDLTTSTETFTVPSVEGLGINQYLRNDKALAKITAVNAEASTITVEWELPTVAEGENPIDLTTITSLEIGSRLDGYDGTVRIYCPGFYIKSKIIGTKRLIWLSTVKIDNTWTYQPEILIDAYRSTVLNTVPTDMGYLSTLPVNSAISVANTADYCRGGDNRAANDKYLTGAEGATVDIFRSDLGKPRTSLSRATFRTECRNAGNNMMSYDQYKNIFYWLYVVEYANFNGQEAYNAELTAEGYHQGGMGNGVTTIINGKHWGWYNGYYPLTPCGYCNEFGNGTGVKDMVITIPSAEDGSTTQTYTFKVPRWRGFDNPFGDIWTNLDGIIIDADADNHPNNMNYVYTCQDPTKFVDILSEDYEKVGEEIHQDGYTKLFDLGDAAHIIPSVMGGNITQYKCDYHWTGGKNTTLRTLLVGGTAGIDLRAGLGYFTSGNGVSYSSTYVGFRSVSSFLSFLDNQ